MAILFKNSTLVSKFSHQERALGRSVSTGGRLEESFVLFDKES